MVDDAAPDRRLCPSTGKLCYRGRRDARRAHRHANYRIRAYECPECGAWHVTNGDKRDGRSQYKGGR